MSNPLKKLAGETAIYGISSVLGRTINFVLVPFYTGIFSAPEYGVVGELYTYVALFNVLYLLGLETSYFRFANKWEGKEDYVFNITQSTVFMSAVWISGLLILLSGPIASGLQFEGKENYIIWLALIMGVDAFVAIPFARLRFENKAKKYASLKLLNIFVNVGLNVFFLILCKDIAEGKYAHGLQGVAQWLYRPEIGVGYVFIANLIANGLYLPLLLPAIRKWKFVPKTVLSSDAIKPLLVYSLPLMLASLAGIINETLDRGFLKFLTPEDLYPDFSNQAVVGIYNACYKLSIFMSLGIQAFRYAAEPFFFAKEKQSDSRELFAQVMTWFVIVGSFIFLFISLNVEWIAKLVLRGEDFRTGLAVVPILLLANLFLGIYYNLSVWFKLSEKTRWGSILALIGAAITIVGNISLIPHIGYMGSAWTTLACYGTMATVSYIAGQKYYPVPYQALKIFFLIISATALYTLGVYVDQLWYALIVPFAFSGVWIFIHRRQSK